MSQWIPRKGFDKLVEAYNMEFGKQDDTVLVIKTYLNVMHDFLEQVPLEKQAQHIGSQISQTKSRIFLADTRESKAKVVLICDLLPNENIYLNIELVQSWKDVQNNLGKFQGLFGSNFTVVDNSKFLDSEAATSKFGMITKKYINKFVKGPVKNHIGKKWIKHNLILKGKK